MLQLLPQRQMAASGHFYEDQRSFFPKSDHNISTLRAAAYDNVAQTDIRIIVTVGYICTDFNKHADTNSRKAEKYLFGSCCGGKGT